MRCRNHDTQPTEGAERRRFQPTEDTKSTEEVTYKEDNEEGRRVSIEILDEMIDKVMEEK